MSWIVPTFSYNGNTWTPTYPATNQQPIATLGQSATRHDSITTSGLQQNVLERIDRLFDLDFPFVPQSDLAGWDAFILWAIAGNQFQYAPDSTAPSTYVTCYLQSTDVPYKRVAFELFTISFKLRVVLTAEIGS
jgi:hypothetical protein